jgi:putative FmdB family regulatory protein
MPIYEYRCQMCQHEFEIMQKISEDALKHCPECGKDTLTKLISRSSFQLKGTGWYATDFKETSNKTSAETTPEVKTEAPVSSPASTTTEVKTESKVETKTETKTAPVTTKSEDK